MEIIWSTIMLFVFTESLYSFPIITSGQNVYETNENLKKYCWPLISKFSHTLLTLFVSISMSKKHVGKENR